MPASAKKGEKGAPPRVLIVHGRPETVARFQSILRDAGMDVQRLANCPADTQGIKDLSPDLILVDSTMTTNSGTPCCLWLRRSLDVAIVALCNSGDRLEGLKMLELGADDFFNEAHSGRETVARVNSLIRRYQRLSEGSSRTATRRATAELGKQEIWSREP